MVRRRHEMPFGAQLQQDGAVRFRLWAPAANTVTLCLEGGPSLPLARCGEGWFELVTRQAIAGSRYRYQIDDGLKVPDPASRFQPEDVHGPSEVIAPVGPPWGDEGWRGRPWHEAVIYELHVGTFSAGGDYAGVEAHLDHLVQLGVTAIELMPLADFPGRRNWGYDGALLFAPDSRYGRPEQLRQLIAAAHRRGLMVLLDVVYNHFGPEGNYLHHYAPQFFTDRCHTPWGAAIDFDDTVSAEVRNFFIHNACYWLEEFGFDGLRIDAVHAIHDRSDPDILEALAVTVQQGIGRQRQVHLVLENDNNVARYLHRDPQGVPWLYAAQWNDDFHHALHVLLTGEHGGYYRDFLTGTLALLGRTLAEGFAWQGEWSDYRGRPRGEPSRELPPLAFVNFLQNHDQVGNRPAGERLSLLAEPAALRAAAAILLLAPSPPLLFMGQEWGSRQPFPYFCDFEPALAQSVRAGRKAELERLLEMGERPPRLALFDPDDPAAAAAAALDWNEAARPEGRAWLTLHRELLMLRRDAIVPRLAGMASGGGRYQLHDGSVLEVSWRLGDGTVLRLSANLSPRSATAPLPAGELLYATDPAPGLLPPWGVAWYIEPPA